MRKILELIILATFLTPVLSHNALGADPIFTNIHNYMMFNLTQGQHFVFFVMGYDSDGDYPLNFSYAKWQQGALFPSFSLKTKNGTAGVMNFTPTNWDVGDPSTGILNYSITFTVKDSVRPNPGLAYAYVYFRVNNTNDPPNITWWHPTQKNVSTRENLSIGFTFNYTTSDIDIPWGDRLNASWYYDHTLRNTSNRTNGSWIFFPDFCSAGKHNISLRVRDRKGTFDSHNWSLRINNTDREP